VAWCVVANYYYRSISDAFRGMVDWVGGTLLPAVVVNSGINMGFEQFGPPGSQMGFWVISPLPSSPDIFFAAEALYTRSMEMAWIARQPGLTLGLSGTFEDPPDGYYGFTQAVVKIHEAFYLCMVATTGATHVTVGGTYVDFDGVHNCGAVWLDLYKTANDLIVMPMYMLNNKYGPSPLEISQPFACVYPSEGNIQSLSAGKVTINQAPPLDTDVSINNGQAILSVISRTITMLP